MPRPHPTSPDKTCSRCKKSKPRGDFRPRPDRNSVNSWCRPCESIRKKERWKAGEGIKARPRWLWRKYKLTVADYDALLTKQKERCAICLTDKPGGYGVFCVDHDHVTGEVRGLLCNDCNTGLGKLGDSVAGLMRALAYVGRPANDNRTPFTTLTEAVQAEAPELAA